MIFKLIDLQPQTYFRKRRGVAAGLSVAGSSLGGVIFPLMVQHLLPQVGFGWTMRICAFLILGMLVIANACISSALPHKPRPFHIMQYIAPLKDFNFLVLCASEFFMFCKLSSQLCRERGKRLIICSGDAYPLQLYCH